MKNLYVYPKWTLGGHGNSRRTRNSHLEVNWKRTFKTNELTCKLSEILLLTIILIWKYYMSVSSQLKKNSIILIIHISKVHFLKKKTDIVNKSAFILYKEHFIFLHCSNEFVFHVTDFWLCFHSRVNSFKFSLHLFSIIYNSNYKFYFTPIEF